GRRVQYRKRPAGDHPAAGQERDRGGESQTGNPVPELCRGVRPGFRGRALADTRPDAAPAYDPSPPAIRAGRHGPRRDRVDAVAAPAVSAVFTGRNRLCRPPALRGITVLWDDTAVRDSSGKPAATRNRTAMPPSSYGTPAIVGLE